VQDPGDLRAALAQPEPQGPVKYNEDFWRKDALEKLVYAATAFRLGIYSAEELEIAENRARFFLARWGTPANTTNQEDYE
jgi:hypothetical protein